VSRQGRWNGAVDTRTGIGGPTGALPGRSTTQHTLDLVVDVTGYFYEY
jgi:hypothetical protein